MTDPIKDDWIKAICKYWNNDMNIKLPLIEGEIDNRGLTLVQNSELTSLIHPIFSFDPINPAGRVLGHGTLFRVDPWDGCATAFHVIEDVLTLNGKTLALKATPKIVALETPKIGYGLLALLPDYWRPITGLVACFRLEEKPFAPPEIRNFSELASIACRRRVIVNPLEAKYLPLDLTSSIPAAGDQITAFGYADLDVDKDGEGDDRAMEQRLYRSDAVILEVQKPDPSSARPWPLARVEANWPGGMSGGPIFNQHGVVIGVVSTSIPSANVATAALFAGWDAGRLTFRQLDPVSPGWIDTFVALDGNDSIVAASTNEAELTPLLETGTARTMSFAKVHFSSGSYILDSQ